VISVQGDKLDWKYIESWCDRHGTRQKVGRNSTDCAEDLSCGFGELKYELLNDGEKD
jgi:hypothetical protein